MQETMYLQLARETMLAVQADAPEKTGRLFEELLNHESAVNNFIVAFHFNERRWIYDVEVEFGSIEMSPAGEGRFRVRYKLGRFGAEADVEHDKSAYMHIRLNMDFTTERMLLTSEQHTP